MIKRLAGLLRLEGAENIGRLLGLAALVGLFAGLGAVVFFWMIEVARHHLLDGLAGYRPPAPSGHKHLYPDTDRPLSRFVLLFLPAVGGLLSSLLTTRWAPEAEGHGTEAAIDAYHRKRGLIGARVPLVKAISSAITLGTGGSAGQEGPVAQIGAGIGSQLAQRLGLSPHERRILLSAGLAAGVGAMFGAPLAAALFVAEVYYAEMDLEVDVIVPSVIASIVAYSVFTTTYGAGPMFAAPDVRFDSPLELLPYLLLAFAVALGAKLFIVALERSHTYFRGLESLPKPVRAMLGGLGVGTVAMVLPEAIGSGYGFVERAMTGEHVWWLLFAVALAKILTTSLTIGSGGSGGVFGPSIFIGGCIGGAVGKLCAVAVPTISASPAAFVVVGMAGFFAAAANTPISTIIMVSELTGNYNLLVPAMWVSIIAFLLLRKSSLFKSQAKSRLESPVHLGEYMGGVLQTLTVGGALTDGEHERMVCVEPGTPLREIVERFARTNHAVFPIIDADQRLVGIIDDRSLREAIGTEGVDDLLVAQDLADTAPVLKPSESLFSAMRKMVASRHDELVVVDEEDDRRVIDTLSRRDLIAAYDHHIQRDLRERRRPRSSITDETFLRQ